MIGAFLLPARIPSVVDFLLPMLVAVCEFILFTASNVVVNFVSRSRMRNRNAAARSPRSMTRLRACWVVHSPVGFAVRDRSTTRSTSRSPHQAVNGAGATQRSAFSSTSPSIDFHSAPGPASPQLRVLQTLNGHPTSSITSIIRRDAARSPHTSTTNGRWSDTGTAGASMDRAVLHGEHRRRGAGGHPDLGVDVLDVAVRGLHRDAERLRHLLGL